MKANTKKKTPNSLPIGTAYRNPFKSLEVQFNCKITTYPDEKFGISRISNQTGDIQVKPIFEFLDIKIQKLLIIQLQKLNSLSSQRGQGKYFDSDIYAMEEIIKQYPKVNKSYIKRAFCILLMESPTHLNMSRCQTLIESLYYENGRKPHLYGSAEMAMGDFGNELASL